MVAHSFADPFFGPAQRLHGATYVAEVEVRTPALGPHHVVMDIGRLHEIVTAALATIDYKNLDEHPAFPGRTSTTERVAEFLAQTIAQAIARLPEDARPRQPATLSLRLRESPTAWVVCEQAIL